MPCPESPCTTLCGARIALARPLCNPAFAPTDAPQLPGRQARSLPWHHAAGCCQRRLPAHGWARHGCCRYAPNTIDINADPEEYHWLLKVRAMCHGCFAARSSACLPPSPPPPAPPPPPRPPAAGAGGPDPHRGGKGGGQRGGRRGAPAAGHRLWSRIRGPPGEAARRARWGGLTLLSLLNPSQSPAVILCLHCPWQTGLCVTTAAISFS